MNYFFKPKFFIIGAVSLMLALGSVASASHQLEASSTYNVVPVYLVPKDRTPDPDYKAKLQTAIELIRDFYGKEMERLGYGYKTFNVQLDTDGRPKIYLIHGNHNAGDYAQQTFGLAQSEFDHFFSRENTLIAAVVESQTYDPKNNIYPGFPSGGGRYIDQPYYYGGAAQMHSPMRLLKTSIAEQLNYFCDETSSDEAWPPPSPLRSKGDIASIHIGGYLHEVGHGFGLQHPHDQNRVISLGFTKLRKYFTNCGEGIKPYINAQDAAVLNNSRFFRTDTPPNDQTPPQITSVNPSGKVELGENLNIAINLADTGGSGLGVIQVQLDGPGYGGAQIHVADIRSLGDGPATYNFSYAPEVALQAGLYRLKLTTFDGASNRNIQEFSLDIAGPPTIPPGNLTSAQIDSIINLLKSFGARQSVIDEVSLAFNRGNIPTPLPSSPTNLTRSCNTAGNRITLSWTAVKGATGYGLRLDDTTNNTATAKDGWYIKGTTDVINNNVTGTSITYPVVAGRSYRWWMYSKKGIVHNYADTAWYLGGLITCPASGTLPPPLATSTPPVVSVQKIAKSATPKPLKDKTPPVITIISPVGNGGATTTQKSAIDILANFTDKNGSGIATSTLMWSGIGIKGQFTQSQDGFVGGPVKLKSGINRIIVRARDLANNQALAYIFVTYKPVVSTSTVSFDESDHDIMSGLASIIDGLIALIDDLAIALSY